VQHLEVIFQVMVLFQYNNSFSTHRFSCHGNESVTSTSVQLLATTDLLLKLTNNYCTLTECGLSQADVVWVNV